MDKKEKAFITKIRKVKKKKLYAFRESFTFDKCFLFLDNIALILYIFELLPFTNILDMINLYWKGIKRLTF